MPGSKARKILLANQSKKAAAKDIKIQKKQRKVRSKLAKDLRTKGDVMSRGLSKAGRGPTRLGDLKINGVRPGGLRSGKASAGGLAPRRK